jgi:RNA polymerase sigma-70 factor (ECF subfamily)
VSVSESTIERYTAADPDVRLMLQVRDDSAAAFEELVLRYQNRVIKVLEHLVGRHRNAEDLAQEVFLRVYRARKNYQPGAKFSTWLFTIANNVARNSLRSHSRRHEVSVEMNGRADDAAGPGLAQMAVEESGLSPSRQFARGEMAEVIQQALDTLGERQKMAILLCKFEEMSYAEIAEIMEMSIPATKSLLSRARVNLKQALTPYLEEGTAPCELPTENH